MADIPSQLAAALRDRYALERELGRGGMVVVYLARDLKHDRPVALKVIRPELGSLAGSERFQREIGFAARLQHPHILPLLDSGAADGQLWFTMPYIEGQSLRDRLRHESRLPLDEALRIAREAAVRAPHGRYLGTGTDVVGALRQVSGVKSADVCWGLPDIVALVEAGDSSSLQDVVLTGIQMIAGVNQTETHLIFE